MAQKSHAPYEPGFRAEVVSDYKSVGLSAAARKHHVCRESVYRWAKAAGVATDLGTKPSIEKATAAAKVKRTQMRTDLLDKIDLVLNRIDGAAPARDCQALAMTFGILLDKYRLECGESTSRSEHLTVDQIEAELQRILADG